MKKLLIIFGLMWFHIFSKAQIVTLQSKALKQITEYNEKNITVSQGMYAQCNGCQWEDTIRYLVVQTVTKIVDSTGKEIGLPQVYNSLTLDNIHGDLKGLSDQQLLHLYYHPTDSLSRLGYNDYGKKYHATGNYPLVRFEVEAPNYVYHIVQGRIKMEQRVIAEKKIISIWIFISQLLNTIIAGWFFGFLFTKSGLRKKWVEQNKQEKIFRYLGFPLITILLILTAYSVGTEHLTGNYFRIALVVLSIVFILAAISTPFILKWFLNGIERIQKRRAQSAKNSAVSTVT